MLNYYETVLNRPDYYRQFKCGDALMTIYNCPLKNKKADLWSKHNYISYIMDGRKIWHTAHGSYDLQKGSCVFVQKGASIVEQFFDAPFCVLVFFMPDEFITDTLLKRTVPLSIPKKEKYNPVIPVSLTGKLDVFFQSMSSFFAETGEPDRTLLELKFRELVLILAEIPGNTELFSYFSSLLNEPQQVSLMRVMEDNYCFNLKLEQYATLCNRSLSTFKRDFERIFGSTPGKWLLEKRLDLAMHLLRHRDKTVSEAAFESGFENPSHFSRSFKEKFGLSPAAARQKNTA